MRLKKIKMPTCMQGCHTLKTLFKIKAFESTTYPANIRMTESYIWCNEEDKEIIKMIVNEFKKRYHEKIER